MGRKILELSDDLLSDVDYCENLADQIANSIQYEIDNGALLLPKSKETLLPQIQSGNFVILPCYTGDGRFAGFHRAVATYHIFEDHTLDFEIFEIGSLVRNHLVSIQDKPDVMFVKLPAFYNYNKDFTPGACVIQAGYQKILRHSRTKNKIIMATSRAKESTRALLEAGFRAINWNSFPMLAATTCDPSCVGHCWEKCTTDGIVCHAQMSAQNLNRYDMCKLLIHQSTIDEQLEVYEQNLKQRYKNPLSMRQQKELPLAITQ